MKIPSAMVIDAAKDMLESMDAGVLEGQRKELQEAAVGFTGSEDFQRGYELGLQTARAFLAMSTADAAELL